MNLQTINNTQELAAVLAGWSASHKAKFVAELEAQLQKRYREMLLTADPHVWPNLQGRAAELQRLINLINGTVTV